MNLQTEPAFITHAKMNRLRSEGHNKSLHDCCYSLSNLALIIAAILVLIFSIKFLNDDPLYEFGDQLLTLGFYRQIIYIIVIMPPILLVPLFNAASAIFLTESHKQELGTSMLCVKLVYQSLLAVLVFVGLVFVAPSIRHNSVANQVGYEIRKHIEHRYTNNFSFEFLDSIQETYECCDELWYRSNNFPGNLPLSCFRQDGTFSTVHMESCTDALAELVSTRCVIIAISLIIILVALASLICIDILELLTYSNRQYDVRTQESLRGRRNRESLNQSAFGAGGSNANDCNNNDDDDDDDLNADIANRLALSEREREALLLAKNNNKQGQQLKSNEDCSSSTQMVTDPYNSATRRAPPILTKANYVTPKVRAQSPTFVYNSNGGNLKDPTEGSMSSLGQSGPVKGVLKKTNSHQRLDSDDDEATMVQQRYELHRELQTRRSLLNVRFAE